MVTIELRKVKCDECGTVQDIKAEGYSLPGAWYQVELIRGEKRSGRIVYTAECCSTECMIKHLHKIKDIPKSLPVDHIF